jgi:hypothetical protein
MLLAFCVLALILYLVFIVDWAAFYPAFAKGGWVVLAVYCLVAVGFYATKTLHLIAAAGAGGHH